MTFVSPVVLSERGVRLEPLALRHEDGLRAAAADGELWKLRVTSVPEPDQTRQYIEDALRMREQGQRFAFAVIDEASETVLGNPIWRTLEICHAMKLEGSKTSDGFKVTSVRILDASMLPMTLQGFAGDCLIKKAVEIAPLVD